MLSMHYLQEIRTLIKESPLSVVETAKKAGIGQASLYESLRGKYVLSADKTKSVLEGIGASSSKIDSLLRLRDELVRSNDTMKPRSRNKVDSARERDHIVSFFRRHDMVVDEDPIITSLLHVRAGTVTLPVLAPGQVDRYENAFGNALKAMLTMESSQSIVVTLIVEVPPEWDGLERFGIHVMNANDALEALKRVSDGKPLAGSTGLDKDVMYF